ncbi:MAG: formyl transferase [Gammaproteobacteria bacterium]|nr:formyl transferase [Gammaproteobacteria bacterium]
MKVAIIGRTEILYETAIRLHNNGYKVACILTAKEAPEYTRTAADFKKLAQSWDIPFAQGGKIKNSEEFLRNSYADIGVSMNYTGIIPQTIIDIFQYGILNAHGGDLPRYRGNACQAWAILNGEKQIGLCIHKMIGGELDSGDIISREKLAIDHNTKVTEVWQWIAKYTPHLFYDAVKKLDNKPNYILEKQSKDFKDALRCYPRQPSDGEIDWSLKAIEVLRLINASNKPYPGAFCRFENDKMIIWDAQLVEQEENICSVPGQVTKIAKGFIEVACGEGKLRILCVEIKGEVKTPSHFVNSIRKRLT